MTPKHTPAWLTDKINIGTTNASHRLKKISDRPHFGNLFFYSAAFLLSILYILYFFYITESPFFHFLFNPSFFEMRYFWVLPTLVPCILISSSLLQILKFPPFYAVLILFILAWAFIPKFLAGSSYHIFSDLTSLALVFIIFSHILVLLFTHKLPLSLRLICFGALEIFLVLFFKQLFDENTFDKSFWILQPYRYIFIFTILAGEELLNHRRFRFNLETISFICSPTNFITPLPI